jgi:G:T-mismatch repair DNA endonuclease (very short patch repair protein)
MKMELPQHMVVIRLLLHGPSWLIEHSGCPKTQIGHPSKQYTLAKTARNMLMDRLKERT